MRLKEKVTPTAVFIITGKGDEEPKSKNSEECFNDPLKVFQYLFSFKNRKSKQHYR